MKQSQKGVVDLVFVALLAVLLLAGVLTTWKVNQTDEAVSDVDTNTSDQVITSGSTNQGDAEHSDLKAGDFDGEMGTFQAEGYITTMQAQREDFDCGPNCTYDERVFFTIVNTPNSSVDSFLKEWEGNSFVDDQAISLGCVFDGVISADKNFAGDKKLNLSRADSTTMLNSTKNNTVKLEISRLVIPSGGGAPNCYSHFDSVTVL